MKRFSGIALVALAALVAGLAQTTTLRAQSAAQLTIDKISGPAALMAGLSGTYEVTVGNSGTVGAPIELHIIFAGTLEQTGRIVAGAGLACEVGHDAGINAVVRCTGGRLDVDETLIVVVQGRGQTAGEGKLVATVNASRSVQEFGSSADDNLLQKTVTIN